MLSSEFTKKLKEELEELKLKGKYKFENELNSKQASEIDILIEGKIRRIINFCSNNYLGLASNKKLISTAKSALDAYGFGIASVRFICGTAKANKELETTLAQFLGFKAALTFPSCLQANNGLFQALFKEEDAIISANLNHASLIDGIRLCKAKKFTYQFNDMKDLIKTIKAIKAKNKVIVSDGVFSMEGEIADLKTIIKIAKEHSCIVVIDDSHATGVLGATGKGSFEHCNVDPNDIDILTSTFGKALGGSSGGFIASSEKIIEKLRNTHRGYLFSNNIQPFQAVVLSKTIEILKQNPSFIAQVNENSKLLVALFEQKNIKVEYHGHPIIIINTKDEILSSKLVNYILNEHNIYLVSVSHPAVPKGEARIRLQVSAMHTKEHCFKLVQAFKAAFTYFNISNF